MPRAEDVIGILLDAALPTRHRGCEALRPLWAEEAMHRAYTLVRLVDARNRGGSRPDGVTAAPGLDTIAARALARQLRELETDDERVMLPCGPALRDVAANLGALFAHPVNVSLTVSTDAVSLPAYKRRALVLTTAELVCNALLHGFPGREAGRIEVGLACDNAASPCLRVADNGVGFMTSGDPEPVVWQSRARLADLLDSGFHQPSIAGWTIAAIHIPGSGI